MGNAHSLKYSIISDINQEMRNNCIAVHPPPLRLPFHPQPSSFSPQLLWAGERERGTPRRHFVTFCQLWQTMSTLSILQHIFAGYCVIYLLNKSRLYFSVAPLLNNDFVILAAENVLNFQLSIIQLSLKVQIQGGGGILKFPETQCATNVTIMLLPATNVLPATG